MLYPMDTLARHETYYQPKGAVYDERGARLPDGKAIKITESNREWFELCASRGDGYITTGKPKMKPATAATGAPPTPSAPPTSNTKGNKK